MALRDQPFLPLYIQDFMTDEKLVECSAAATGVFIRIMCLMHKEEEYGKILLKQKYKQTGQQISDFASQLAGKMPYTFAIIEAALSELLNEKVLHFRGEYLCQKRMIEDNELSITRSKAGKNGVKAKKKKGKNFAEGFATDFASAKHRANAENENEGEIENVNELFLNRGLGKDLPIVPQMVGLFLDKFPGYPVDPEQDYRACLEIAIKITAANGWPKNSYLNGKFDATLQKWQEIIDFIVTDKWFSTRSIFDLNKEFQRLIQTKNGAGKLNTAGGQTPGRTSQRGPVNGGDPGAIVTAGGAGDDL